MTHDDSLKAYKIHYRHDILANTIVYAKTYDEALKLGFAEFRRNTGTVENLDNSELADVVLAAEQLD